MSRLAPWLFGALLCAEAAAQPWGVERSSPRGEPSERSDRDSDRESWFPRSEPLSPARDEPARGSGGSGSWTPPPKEERDADLTRCDRYQAQLETLLREEMRGKSTGAQQRALHEQRMRDGC